MRARRIRSGKRDVSGDRNHRPSITSTRYTRCRSFNLNPLARQIALSNAGFGRESFSEQEIKECRKQYIHDLDKRLGRFIKDHRVDLSKDHRVDLSNVTEIKSDLTLIGAGASSSYSLKGIEGLLKKNSPKEKIKFTIVSPDDNTLFRGVFNDSSGFNLSSEILNPPYDNILGFPDFLNRFGIKFGDNLNVARIFMGDFLQFRALDSLEKLAELPIDVQYVPHKAIAATTISEGRKGNKLVQSITTACPENYLSTIEVKSDYYLFAVSNFGPRPIVYPGNAPVIFNPLAMKRGDQNWQKIKNAPYGSNIYLEGGGATGVECYNKILLHLGRDDLNFIIYTNNAEKTRDQIFHSFENLQIIRTEEVEHLTLEEKYKNAGVIINATGFCFDLRMGTLASAFLDSSQITSSKRLQYMSTSSKGQIHTIQNEYHAESTVKNVYAIGALASEIPIIAYIGPGAKIKTSDVVKKIINKDYPSLDLNKDKKNGSEYIGTTTTFYKKSLPGNKDEQENAKLLRIAAQKIAQKMLLPGQFPQHVIFERDSEDNLLVAASSIQTRGLDKDASAEFLQNKYFKGISAYQSMVTLNDQGRSVFKVGKFERPVAGRNAIMNFLDMFSFKFPDEDKIFFRAMEFDEIRRAKNEMGYPPELLEEYNSKNPYVALIALASFGGIGEDNEDYDIVDRAIESAFREKYQVLAINKGGSIPEEQHKVRKGKINAQSTYSTSQIKELTKILDDEYTFKSPESTFGITSKIRKRFLKANRRLHLKKHVNLLSLGIAGTSEFTHRKPEPFEIAFAFDEIAHFKSCNNTIYNAMRSIFDKSYDHNWQFSESQSNRFEDPNTKDIITDIYSELYPALIEPDSFIDCSKMHAENSSKKSHSVTSEITSLLLDTMKDIAKYSGDIKRLELPATEIQSAVHVPISREQAVYVK